MAANPVASAVEAVPPTSHGNVPNFGRRPRKGIPSSPQRHWRPLFGGGACPGGGAIIPVKSPTVWVTRTSSHCCIAIADGKSENTRKPTSTSTCWATSATMVESPTPRAARDSSQGRRMDSVTPGSDSGSPCSTAS